MYDIQSYKWQQVSLHTAQTVHSYVPSISIVKHKLVKIYLSFLYTLNFFLCFFFLYHFAVNKGFHKYVIDLFLVVCVWIGFDKVENTTKSSAVAMLRVIEYFAKSLKITQIIKSHS